MEPNAIAKEAKTVRFFRRKMDGHTIIGSNHIIRFRVPQMTKDISDSRMLSNVPGELGVTDLEVM